MPSKPIKLTKSEVKNIFTALRKANDYDQGLSDAYDGRGPESEKALRCAARYRKIRAKLGAYLGLSVKNGLDQLIEEAELLSLSELKSRS